MPPNLQHTYCHLVSAPAQPHGPLLDQSEIQKLAQKKNNTVKGLLLTVYPLR